MDFGERDSFVASMKGVYSVDQFCRCHCRSPTKLPLHQIQEAAYFLKSCYRYFPEKAYDVAVVDPGVGTERRALLVAAAGSFFVGPDNGLFTEVLEQEEGAKVWQINNPQYRLETVGSTFDGRECVAPAAARSSKGVPPTFFGLVVHHPIRRSVAIPVWHEELLIGKIISIDRFGNLISPYLRQAGSWFRCCKRTNGGDPYRHVHH